MAKAKDAFRTISEVSAWLDTPAHVLRFWESKFSQIKPVKRAGGRRYYRPTDMALIGGIKMLLHEQGMTIKGTQKVLREQGVKHVASLSPPIKADEAETPATEASDTPMEDAVKAPVAEKPIVLTPQMAIPTQEPQPLEDASDITPDKDPEPASQFFRTFKTASPDVLRERAADIAPLVARLEQVRDRMRDA